MDTILHQLGGLLLGAVPTVLLFLTTLVLYKVILHKKLVAVLAERRARTEGAIQKAKADVAAAEAKTTDYENQLREAKLALYKAQETRRKQLMDARSAALTEARAKADAMVKDARAGIDRDVQEARKNLQAESEKLAAEVVHAVLAGAAAGGAR